MVQMAQNNAHVCNIVFSGSSLQLLIDDSSSFHTSAWVVPTIFSSFSIIPLDKLLVVFQDSAQCHFHFDSSLSQPS